MCCSPWGCKELDATERLNSNNSSYCELPWRLSGKELLANAGNVGSVPGTGRSPRRGDDYLLQYAYLGNPMDRGAWWATVHEVRKESNTSEQLNINNNILTTCGWTLSVEELALVRRSHIVAACRIVKKKKKDIGDKQLSSILSLLIYALLLCDTREVD